MTDLLGLVGILVLLGFVWVALGGPLEGGNLQPFLAPPYVSLPPAPEYAPPSYLSRPTETPLLGRSAWSGQVKIGAGNAQYEYQPNQEHITLTNYSDQPVTITGWMLANGRNRRLYPVGPTEASGVSDFVLIPPAVNVLADGEAIPPVPIILEPGAVVTINTGSPPATSDWPASSAGGLAVSAFRHNLCLGYLDETVRNFRPNPTFYSACPGPDQEPGLERLDDDCYDYVRYLNRCHEPEFRRDRDGYDTVDGRRLNLSGHCRAYIQSHYNYQACVANHRADSNFLGRDWRVFLKRHWELWADNRETITLYDTGGQIVDQVSY